MSSFGRRNIPLAVTLRPKILDDIVGQEHLIGPGAKLRKLIESDTLASILLFGPAGTGKTTISEVIAAQTKSTFVRLNATQASVKDIRKHGQAAEKEDGHVVIFVDELHRFSKTQQDTLLPFVENGHIIFIGASTENPFHSVISGLLSRSQMICELEPLKPQHLALVLKRAVAYYRIHGSPTKVSKEAAMHIIMVANGDARKVISILEVAKTVAEDEHITLELVKAVSPSKHMVFNTQMHYDFASAAQGSLQASDPDAAIYWVAKWLESGEDPRYIARRIMVSASEDACGDPHAAMLAHSAYVAACEIGRPECDIILAHAVIAIATAPRDKSSACAIWEAIKDIRAGENIEIPKEMRDSHYTAAAELGHGAYHDGMNMDQYVGISRRYYHPEKWVT